LITIRPEQPFDYTAIREMILTVFKETYGTGPLEADLVEAIRASDAYVPELSLVALDGDMIVGHSMFSLVQIERVAGRTEPALVLAPLGMYKAYQRKGIGTRLMEQSLKTARRLGYDWAFLQGSPDYYGRFGFRPDRQFGFVSSFQAEAKYNMALPLRDDAVEGNGSRLIYPEPTWTPLL